MSRHDPVPHVLERTPVRWTPARKEELVRAIGEERISRDQALGRFNLSADELDSWTGRFERLGRPGLAVTRLQVTR